MNHVKGQNFERMSMPNYDFITIIRGIAALTVTLIEQDIPHSDVR